MPVPEVAYSETQINSAKFAAAGTQYVINVRVHYITNNIPVVNQELQALDIVGTLNMYFNSANIFFKNKGFNNINDASLLNFSNSNINAFLTTHASADAMDIFIVNSFFSNVSPGSMSGLTVSAVIPPTNQIYNGVVLLRKDSLPTLSSATPTNVDLKYHTAVHEVGHFLGLYHTHQQWKLNANNVLVTATDTECAQEENYNNSEWNTLGDRIQDTNPDRSMVKYSNGGTQYASGCTINQGGWTTNTTCGSSVNFSLFNPPMSNIMSYYSTCKTSFTTGQKDYMRTFLSVETASGRFLNAKMNIVDSLYEPFATEVTGGTPSDPPVYSRTVSPSDDGTGMNVWNCPDYKLRFQKGFNYEFSNATIVTVTTTPNIQSNYSINNQSLFVKIPYISSFVYEYGGISCFSTFEPYVTGTIKTANSLTSPIISTETLDASRASSPDLIQSLPAEKYYTIERETQAGDSATKTIYKQ